MSRYCRLLLAPLFALCLAASSSAAGRDYIYVIDTSRSMLKDGLFNHVKSELDRLLGSMTVGDRLIVYAFDADVRVVEDVTIEGSTNVAAARQRIDGLQAQGHWTYLTRAMDLAFRRAEELAQAGSSRERVIYILTDGLNDPPPSERQAPITLDQIVQTHGQQLRRTGTALFMVTFGVHLASRDSALIENDLGGQVTALPRALPPSRTLDLRTVVVGPVTQTLRLSPGAGPKSVVASVFARRDRMTAGGVSLQFVPATLAAGVTMPARWDAVLEGDTVVVPLQFTVDGTQMVGDSARVLLAVSAVDAVVSVDRIAVVVAKDVVVATPPSAPLSSNLPLLGVAGLLLLVALALFALWYSRPRFDAFAKLEWLDADLQSVIDTLPLQDAQRGLSWSVVVARDWKGAVGGEGYPPRAFAVRKHGTGLRVTPLSLPGGIATSGDDQSAQGMRPFEVASGERFLVGEAPFRFVSE